MFIHEKAHVDDTVSIGEGTHIWQFASVIRGAVLGKNCSVASGACIDGSLIGDNCVIAHNLAMGPGFKLGDGVFIGPNVTFCNDAFPRAHKRGFDVSGYSNGKYAVIVEDGATIGAGAVILPGVRIGAGAMVAANATVTKDVACDHIWRADGSRRPILRESEKARVRFVMEVVDA